MQKFPIKVSSYPSGNSLGTWKCSTTVDGILLMRTGGDVIEIPVGSEITIYVTSPDLQHGFKVTDTNINVMVVPGQVSTVKYTFDEVGEFLYICHEYCGRGHANMAGVVRVVSGTGASS